MPATISLLADQVLRRLKSGRSDAATGITMEDLKRSVVQVLNGLLRIGHLQNMQGGETIPDGIMMATYLNVPVSTYQKNMATCILPAIPVNLPNGMGLFEIKPSQVDIFDDNGYGNEVGNVEPFVPIKLGDYRLALGCRLITEYSGFIGFWPIGTRVVITKNLPLFDINAVDITMAVADFDQLDEDAPLPIYADYEEQVVDGVYKKFAGIPPAMPSIDNITETLNTK